MYGILLSRLGWRALLLLGIVRQATKRICKIVGPSLAASLELLDVLVLHADVLQNWLN